MVGTKCPVTKCHVTKCPPPDVISIDNPSSSNSVDVSDDHDIQPSNINPINDKVFSSDGTNSDDKQIENREKNRSLPKVKTTVLS